MEKDKTLAEINRTVQQKDSPIGSKMICRMMGVWLIGNKVHSIRVVESCHSLLIVRGSIRVRASHMKILADL